MSRTLGQHRTVNRHGKPYCCFLFLSEVAYSVSLPSFLQGNCDELLSGVDVNIPDDNFSAQPGELYALNT